MDTKSQKMPYADYMAELAKSKFIIGLGDDEPIAENRTEISQVCTYNEFLATMRLLGYEMPEILRLIDRMWFGDEALSFYQGDGVYLFMEGYNG